LRARGAVAGSKRRRRNSGETKKQRKANPPPRRCGDAGPQGHGGENAGRRSGEMDSSDFEGDSDAGRYGAVLLKRQ
jgi:hypothetical protein